MLVRIHPVLPIVLCLAFAPGPCPAQVFGLEGAPATDTGAEAGTQALVLSGGGRTLHLLTATDEDRARDLTAPMDFRSVRDLTLENPALLEALDAGGEELQAPEFSGVPVELIHSVFMQTDQAEAMAQYLHYECDEGWEADDCFTTRAHGEFLGQYDQIRRDNRRMIAAGFGEHGGSAGEELANRLGIWMTENLVIFDPGSRRAPGRMVVLSDLTMAGGEVVPDASRALEEGPLDRGRRVRTVAVYQVTFAARSLDEPRASSLSESPVLEFALLSAACVVDDAGGETVAVGASGSRAIRQIRRQLEDLSPSVSD